MTVLEAATRVLWQAKEPLQSKEMAQRMMAEGLWKTSGLTPGSTVAAEIYGHMKVYGDKSPFVLSEPGRFTLGKTHMTVELPDVLSYFEGLGQSSKGTAIGSLSFLDAAERVLREIGKGHAMHYAEVTREALQHGWLTTTGNTPDATMYASIITDVNRRQVAGLASRFIRPGPGMVALAEPKEPALVDRIEEHNTMVRQRVLEHLLSMPPADLERLVGRLMAEMGFVDIDVTPPSGDGGVDARGVLVVADAIRIRMAVQVKRWRKNVLAPVVQGLRGSLDAHERGLIVTTSDFSSGAREEASRRDAMPIALLGRDQLVSLLIQYGIGVTKTELPDLIELDENQFPSTAAGQESSPAKGGQEKDTFGVDVGVHLYKRKLNANCYNPADGNIWYVPGFSALSHQCAAGGQHRVLSVDCDSLVRQVAGRQQIPNMVQRRNE